MNKTKHEKFSKIKYPLRWPNVVVFKNPDFKTRRAFRAPRIRKLNDGFCYGTFQNGTYFLCLLSHGTCLKSNDTGPWNFGTDLKSTWKIKFLINTSKKFGLGYQISSIFLKMISCEKNFSFLNNYIFWTTLFSEIVPIFSRLGTVFLRYKCLF